MITKPFEPDDITKLTLVSDPRANPLECKVLYVHGRMDKEKNKYIYTVWEVSPNQPPRPLTKGPSDTCPKWSPSGGLVAFLSSREDEKTRELWVMKPGGEPWRAFKAEAGIHEYEWVGDEEIVVLAGYDKQNEVVHVIEHLPVWVNGVGYNYFVKQKLQLLRLGGEPETLVEAGKDKWIEGFAVSPNGRYLIYTITTDELKPYLSEIHLYDLMERTDKVIAKDWIVWNVGWTDSDNKAWFIGKERNYARDKGISIAHTRLYTITLNGEIECLTCKYPYNISSSVNSDGRGPRCGKPVAWKAGKAYFYTSVKGRVFLALLEPEGEGPLLLYELGDGSIDGFSLGKDCIYYTMMNHREPAELYCYDPKTGVRKKMTWHNVGFTNSIWLGSHEHFLVKASDGDNIDAWIMKPRDFDESKKYPAILYVHGGPKTMFGEGFMMDFHALAARGFAVIYSNPRGSDGYTEDFADIKGDYGGRDYQDLMEVVEEALKKYPWIDKDKLGVTGGSYGGFMTNWIITRTKIFKAAVTQRSCSDWISDYGTTDIGWYFTPEAVLGNAEAPPPWLAPEKYMEKSPLWSIENVETPLLIIHSIEDYRCFLGQAIELYTALKLKNIDTKLALFPGENHDLSRSGKPKARIERLKLILGWFEKYLKGVEPIVSSGKESK
ncbi:MAG: S9 family peptidase [Desulfurococcales archaeon]|nr:S9 family peptidase [Desulfurococcales archaeon]